MSIVSMMAFAGNVQQNQPPINEIIFATEGKGSKPSGSIFINVAQYKTFGHFIAAMKNMILTDEINSCLAGDVVRIFGENRDLISLNANISDMYIRSDERFCIVFRAAKTKKSKKKSKKSKLNPVQLMGAGFPEGDGYRTLTSSFKVTAHETLADFVDSLKNSLTPNGYPFVEGDIVSVSMKGGEDLSLDTRIADLNVDAEDSFKIIYWCKKNQAVAEPDNDAISEIA